MLEDGPTQPSARSQGAGCISKHLRDPSRIGAGVFGAPHCHLEWPSRVEQGTPRLGCCFGRLLAQQIIGVPKREPRGAAASGRFDRQVYVSLPDIRGREQLLNVHMRKVPVGQDIRADILARGTPGFSGADLANLVNEAALFAARRNGRVVEMQDFEKAKDKIMMGAERKSMVMDEDERRNTAYHESGHALIGKMLPKLDPVHKVTIIPRGGALGVTVSLPEKDRYSIDKIQMLNRISMLFGGRIAEEVFMGQMTTGASNDFERATQMARDMVMRYGMSDALGPMVYAENEGEIFLGRSVTKTTNISEETMRRVDTEVRRIIDEQYGIARKLIEDNADKMHAMAKALLEWETIDGEQIEDIMQGRPPRAPKDWSGSSPPSSGSGTAPAVGGAATTAA